MKTTLAFFTVLALLFFAFWQNADIDLLIIINLDRNKHLDSFFQFITDSVSPITIVFFLLLAVGFIAKYKALTTRGLFIAGSYLTSSLISTALKHVVDRPRPFITYPFLEKITSGGSPSFPSGHTSDAFALAAAVSIAFPKWYVITPALLWATAVGYSRMDLGVHYPSDVLMGILVGTGSAYLGRYVNNKYFGRTAII